MRNALHRVALAFLVLILLTAPVPAADGRVHRAEREPGLAAVLWQALQKLSPLASKSSGTMDPDGKPLPPKPAVQTDASGTMDPDGRM